MQEDNMYIRRSSVQNIPKEQEEAADRERIDVLNEAPLIKSEIDLLTKDAETLERSILSISEEALTSEKTDLFIRETLANRKAAASIRASIARMEALVEEYIKSR